MICCSSCADNSRADNGGKKAEWKVGYWYWSGGSRGTAENDRAPVEMLYVRAGEFHSGSTYEKNKPGMFWPEHLPPAKTYFAVFRCDGPKCTDPAIIPDLSRNYQGVKQQALKTGQKISGLQIDYDCPTVDLGGYGRFLKELRSSLLEGEMLSVTALLDWFGRGTDVADVVESVDEFVPQFYDVDYRKLAAPDGGIAEPIDAARWAPVFNAYKKPYRIGIACFGRVVQTGDRTVAREELKEPLVYGTYGTPLQTAAEHKAAFVPSGISTAGETIARLKGGSGDMISTVKLIVPTRESVSSAYAAARAFGGYCSGVIFFRYGLRDEGMTLSTSEVAATISGKPLPQEATAVEVRDGLCAAVTCRDLFIRPRDRLSSRATVITLRSSHDLEYFISNGVVHTKLKGPRLIEATIPAFPGTPRIPLGRAVTRDPARFEVEEKR